MNRISSMIIGFGLTAFMAVNHSNNKLTEDNDRIIQDYRDSVNLPRKTKKKVRKQLLKEYNLNCSILEWGKQMFTF